MTQSLTTAGNLRLREGGRIQIRNVNWNLRGEAICRNRRRGVNLPTARDPACERDTGVKLPVFFLSSDLGLLTVSSSV